MVEDTRREVAKFVCDEIVIWENAATHVPHPVKIVGVNALQPQITYRYILLDQTNPKSEYSPSDRFFKTPGDWLDHRRKELRAQADDAAQVCQGLHAQIEDYERLMRLAAQAFLRADQRPDQHPEFYAYQAGPVDRIKTGCKTWVARLKGKAIWQFTADTTDTLVAVVLGAHPGATIEFPASEESHHPTVDLMTHDFLVRSVTAKDKEKYQGLLAYVAFQRINPSLEYQAAARNLSDSWSYTSNSLGHIIQIIRTDYHDSVITLGHIYGD
jgi:hypothetical protein